MTDSESILFDSRYPIDKILYESEPLFATTPAAEPIIPALFDGSFPHPAGSQTVVSGMFSIDGDNYYPFGGFITGEFVPGGNAEYITLEAWCDDTTVYFSGITAYFEPQNLQFYFFMESLA